MDTDKYNPMRKENRNDYGRTSTNLEQNQPCVRNQVDDKIFHPEGVGEMDEAGMDAAQAHESDKLAEITGGEFGHWQDSAPVLRLSAYLRANRDAGIILCCRGDAPCLVFDPPLRRSDIGSMRLAIAEHAYDMAVDAKRDLSILIQSGIINKDDMGTLDDIDAVGSSARDFLYGSRSPKKSLHLEIITGWKNGSN